MERCGWWWDQLLALCRRMIDLGYNRFGINGVTLNRAGFPDGNVSVFSATLDPIVHLSPGHHVDAYLIGGGGLYHLNQEFTQPSAATLTAFDPFFGFYNVVVPTTQVLSSYSVNKPGVNGGAGFAIGTKWHGKFFAEARYARIFMGNDRHVDYIPVSFGFRWVERSRRHVAVEFPEAVLRNCRRPLSLLRSRHGEEECSAGAQFGFNPNPAAIVLDDLLASGKANAAA